MLTSLDFLRPGAPWPPPSEVERLTQYEANRKLFEGRHDQVFKDWVRLIREDQKATLEIILNWHKRLSILWADLLLGEPPRITAGDQGSAEQTAVELLIEDNELHNVAYEVAIDVSRFGSGVFKVRYDDGSIIEGQPPALWFPVASPDNIKAIQAHVLAWTYETVEQSFLGTRKSQWLRAEIHERGKINTQLFRMAESMIGDLVEEEEQLTGIDDFLIIPVNNLLTTDRVTGIDDYGDLDSIIQELEIRVAQISRILDKHADPNMYGPNTALDMDPVTGETTFRGGGKYFPVHPEDKPPGYVTWDGQLDAAFRQIETLMEQLYIISETSPAAFGQLKSGLAESGSALRRLMMAPLAKVNRIRMRFDPALKRAIKVASALAVAQGARDMVKLESIRIDWQDGLPQDPREQTDIEVARKGAGLTSTESSLRRLDGLDGQALEEEVERILSDVNGEVPAAYRPQLQPVSQVQQE